MFKSLLIKLAVIIGLISSPQPSLTPETPVSEDFKEKPAILETLPPLIIATNSPEVDEIASPLAQSTTTELGEGETCVQYARRRSPKKVARVAGAAEISATAATPTPNAWLLWQPSQKNPFGHVSVVEEIADGRVLISEANLNLDGQVTWRWIDLDNPLIKGFRH